MSTHSDVEKFLQAVFGSDWREKAFLCNSGDWKRKKLEELDPALDCYWCVGAIPWGKARKVENVENVRALVIDDVGTKVLGAHVRRTLAQATAITLTSKGNYQWAYGLPAPIAPEAWRGFFAGVEAALGQKLDGGDAVHLFRLPIGVNTKPGKGNRVEQDILNHMTKLRSWNTPAPVGGPSGPSSSGGDGAVDKLGRESLRELVMLVPNNPDTSRDTWSDVGHDVKATCEDAEDGWEIFRDWSAMWEGVGSSGRGYEETYTREKWEGFGAGGLKSKGNGLRARAAIANPEGYRKWLFARALEAFPDDLPSGGGSGGGGGYKPAHVTAAEAVILAERGRLGWLSTASHRWAAYDEVMGRWEVGDDDSEMRTAVRIEIERRQGMGVDAKTSHEMGKSAWRLAVQALLVRERRLRIVAGRFDSDLDVVGVPGGILRLDRAMGLWAAERGRAGHMVSKALATRPGPSTCPSKSLTPVWTGFLDDFTMGDKTLALWWQAFCGYCLTGHTTEQIVVFLYGTGGNGKSVFLDIVGEVMGDYHVRADHRLFMAKTGNFHLAPLAALEGARLVTCPDVGVNAVWDVGLVKAISGGGMITANRMRENSTSFEPQCKVVLAGNEKPRLDNVDAGVKRRFQLVPATKVPKRVDKLLMEKLRAEHGGILEWMLRGWEMWALGGLPACAAIESETKSYLDGADVFGRWIGETLTANAEDKTRHRMVDLWRSWDAFRMGEGAGHHCAPNDVTRLSTKLKEAGFWVCRDNKGGYVDGITVTKADVF